MTKTAAPMTSGSIWKQMTFFAMPIFLGNLFQQLYNTVDSLIVGNFLGSSALAAVSSSGSLIFMLIGFLSGISAGAGVIVARFFGAGDEKNLQRAVHTTVAFGLVAGVLMTGVGVALSPQILRWMDTPESVMRESVTYLQIYFAGSLGFVMYNVLVGILQAVGDSRHPLYYLIVSSVINLVLDLLFITGFHTGVGGAAVATVISQIVSALLCFWQLLRTKESYGLKIRKIRFDKGILVQIIKIGLPSGRTVQYQCIRRNGNGGLWGLHKGGRVRFSAHQQLYYGTDDICRTESGCKAGGAHEKRGAIWNSRSSYIGRTDWCRGISSGTTADRGI